MLSKDKHIFFVGIGGAGMSGIAEVLHQQGFQVSGSDLVESEVTAHLMQLGIMIHIGHDVKHIDDVDVVVMTSAVKADHPELVAARHQKIPVLKRAEILAELMQLKRGIAVAGTSGKTTTTSLLAAIMNAARLDPTFIIGGKVNSVSANAQLGKGEFLLAEADESDASFLYLQPEVSIVTNINPDHLYNYNNDFSLLRKAFVEFLHRLPQDGLAVLCVDDEHVKTLMSDVSCSKVTYGFSSKADIVAVDAKVADGMMNFIVKQKNYQDLLITLNMLGKHNVLNALAAVAVARFLNIDDDIIADGLKNFSGVARRFNVLGEKNIVGKKVCVVDDYGHHPKEISAAIVTTRQTWPTRKITMVFQPHRYTRTRDLFDEFVKVLQQVDRLILLPIYPACEQAIPGVTSDALAAALRGKTSSSPSLLSKGRGEFICNELLDALKQTLQSNDILLMQGAGDVGLLIKQLA